MGLTSRVGGFEASCTLWQTVTAAAGAVLVVGACSYAVRVTASGVLDGPRDSIFFVRGQVECIVTVLTLTGSLDPNLERHLAATVDDLLTRQ